MEVKVDRQMIDVSGWTETNPSWQYVCTGCGNVMTIYNNPRGKFVSWIYYEDGEKSAHLSWHCKKCWARVPDGEVANRQRPSTARKFLPGLTTVTGSFDSLEAEQKGIDWQKMPGHDLTFKGQVIGKVTKVSAEVFKPISFDFILNAKGVALAAEIFGVKAVG